MQALLNGLNEEEVEVLDAWLAQNNAKLPSLEAVDGLFTAMMIAPDYPAPSLWLPIALGGDVQLAAENPQILDLVNRHWNEVAALIGPAAEAEALKEWAPLIFDANDDIPADKTDTGYGQHWAFGFHIGIDELPQARLALGLDQDPDQANEEENSPLGLLAPLVMLEEGAFPDHPEDKLTLEQLRALEDEMVDNILVLRDYFSDWRRKKQLGTVIKTEPKVGRNDDCPCGSGKKYKKCCAKAE